MTADNLKECQQTAKLLAYRAAADLDDIIENDIVIETIRSNDEANVVNDNNDVEAEENVALQKRRNLNIELSRIASVLNVASEKLQSIQNVVVDHSNLFLGETGGGTTTTGGGEGAGADSDPMPRYEESPGRYICYMLVSSTAFQILLNLMIVLNTVCLAAEHYDQPESWTTFLRQSHYFFIAIFTFEIYAKLKGLGSSKCREDGFFT